VAASRPCIVQNALLTESSGAPVRLTLDELVESFADMPLQVNVTPDGHGDCVRRVRSAPSDKVQNMFVEPENRTMTAEQFRTHLRACCCSKLQHQTAVPEDDKLALHIFASTVDENGKENTRKQRAELQHDSSSSQHYSGVPYYSRQNDCLRAELGALWKSDFFPDSIEWAAEAFGVGPPDAVNLWIGNQHSTSSMHKDHYENMFYVLEGEKVFTVCPPADAPFLNECECLAGDFICSGGEWKVRQQWNASSNSDNHDGTTTDDGAVPATVRWIAANVLDPAHYDSKEFPLLRHAHPIEIRVKAGEMLYLPALWFHSVTQTTETLGVNYWYDMKFDSAAWCYFHFLQQLHVPVASPSD
jgi:jumonji domain-containing protein 7